MGLRKADVLAQKEDADWKDSVRLFVDGDALPAHSRVDNVVTADANGALADQDGRTPEVGDSIILDYIGPSTNTGVYVIDDLGSGGSKFQFTRRSDFDEDDNVTEGLRVPIADGDDFGGRVALITTVGDIQINTTAIDFELDVSGASGIQQGLTWNFDGASQADANPGSGKFRANNATPSSATQIFIHPLSLSTAGLNSLLALQDVPGFLYVEQLDDPTRWVLYDITAISVAGAGYQKLQVSINGVPPSAEIEDGKEISFAFLVPPAPLSTAHAETTGQTADDHHSEAHTIASHSDTTATGAELETLTDGSLADPLHDHDHDALTGFVLNEHRPVNDAGSSTTEVWSSSKIDGEISAVLAGVDTKPGVDTVTTGLGNIALTGEQTLNGLLTSASLVLVTEQTLPAQNGFYVTAAGAWTRATFADEDAEVTNGNVTHVLNSGSTKFKNKYLLVTPDPIVVGTTGQTWEEHRDIDFGTTSGTATEGDDSRVPSQDENDALVGTDGTPSTANKYVTDSDSRNTDARTPTAHTIDSHSDTDATGAELDTLTDGSDASSLHTHDGVGSSLQGETWVFNTATGDADPGGAAFRVNNADQSLATQAFVDDIANSSAPTGANGVSLLSTGDVLYIEQQDDSTRFALYLITAPNVVGAPSYQKLQISALANGSALELNKACTFRIFKASNVVQTGAPNDNFITGATGADNGAGPGGSGDSGGVLGGDGGDGTTGGGTGGTASTTGGDGGDSTSSGSAGAGGGADLAGGKGGAATGASGGGGNGGNQIISGGDGGTSDNGIGGGGGEVNTFAGAGADSQGGTSTPGGGGLVQHRGGGGGAAGGGSPGGSGGSYSADAGEGGGSDGTSAGGSGGDGGVAGGGGGSGSGGANAGTGGPMSAIGGGGGLVNSGDGSAGAGGVSSTQGGNGGNSSTTAGSTPGAGGVGLLDGGAGGLANAGSGSDGGDGGDAIVRGGAGGTGDSTAGADGRVLIGDQDTQEIRSGNVTDKPKFVHLGGTRTPVKDLGAFNAATATADLKDSDHFKLSMQGACTLAFANVSDGQSGKIQVTHDGASATLAKGTNVTFPGGTLALSTGSGDIDVLCYLVEGVNIRVWVEGLDFS